MRKLLAISGNILLAILLVLPLGMAQAEDKAKNKTFSEAELDQMMAPIALYPDSLLAQILMATTYPADITEAVKWSKDNPKQEGDAAVKAVQDKSWDPSVMSLVAFPQVLEMMGKQADWVQNVGDAFLANSEGVMDTVQKLRKKAKDEGNLKTTEQQKVIVEEQASETVIIVEPADPKVVYVPVYNPTVVYGTWWWPHYSPWYYYPPYGRYGYYGYGFGGAVMRGIGFGIGVGITRALWGGCHWGRGRGSVNINVNKFNNINVNRNKINSNNRNSNWKHNSNNRRGVPYRDNKSRQQFGNKRSGADKRQNYRGRDAQRNKARSTLDKRAVNPSTGRKQLQGAGGDRARNSVNKANRQVSQGRFNSGKTSQHRNLSDRSAGRSSSSRNNAFRNSNNAHSSRQNINRGSYSNRSMSHRSSGGGRRGGGGRRRGGGGRRR